MSRTKLILPICLSFGLIACKETVENNVKQSLANSAVVEENVAVFKAKVRSALGENEHLKANTKNWKKLFVGQNIRDNDQIRTKQESEVVLNTADGTVFVISENSSVEFNAELQESVKGEVNIFIRKGNIQFDVQKQKDNQFNFKTGTATASIRGTAGFVGSLDGQLVASLKEGRVEVKDAKGRSSDITQNQTVLITKSGEAKTFQLESSGTTALFAALNEMSKTGSLDNMEQLEKDLKQFDTKYVDQRKEFEQNLKVNPVVIPKAISQPSITLEAKMTAGVLVTVMGQTDTVPASGVYKRTFSWDKSAAGTKRFMAVCSNGSVEVPCNVWVTEYAPVAEAPATEAPAAEVPVEEKPAESVTEDQANSGSAAVNPADSLDSVAREKVAEKPRVVPKPGYGLVIKLAEDPLDTLRLVEVSKNGETSDSLKIMLTGISDANMKKIESITIQREDVSEVGARSEWVQSYVQEDNEIQGREYAVPLQVAVGQTLRYTVVAVLKDGSEVQESVCYRGVEK